MNGRKKRQWLMEILSIASFGAVAVVLCMMFFIETEPAKETSIFSLVCGICFWIFTICGVGLQAALALQVRRARKQSLSKRLGLIHFNSNKSALISDIVFAVSFVIFLILVIFTSGTSIFAYVVLAILFLSFCMHCILNGSTYAYLINENGRNDKCKEKEEL